MNQTDEYATLRAAFAAGCRIQAWTLNSGADTSRDGYWRTLKSDGAPMFSCPAHLYRVHPEDISLIAELGQEVGAVACRGYAKLGIGAYLIEHSAESEPAALMLCVASDEEKAGRTVGDLKTFEGERQPIPAEKMTIRIDFANVAGLDALEQQLRLLREVHFPTSPAHTSGARDAEIEAVKSALDRAYWLGQEYWRLADSQSYSDNRRSDETRSRYNQLVIDTLAAMRQEGGNG